MFNALIWNRTTVTKSSNFLPEFLAANIITITLTFQFRSAQLYLSLLILFKIAKQNNQFLLTRDFFPDFTKWSSWMVQTEMFPTPSEFNGSSCSSYYEVSQSPPKKDINYILNCKRLQEILSFSHLWSLAVAATYWMTTGDLQVLHILICPNPQFLSCFLTHPGTRAVLTSL